VSQIEIGRRPDFLIVGAPKAGTTSLNDYLAAHPQIFMAPKELHFFGAEWDRWTAAQYAEFFKEAREDQIAGETSVRYFASPSAAESIHAQVPHAKIVVMLRHPVEAIVSMHRDLVFLGHETLDLRQALEADEQRRAHTTAGWSNPLIYRDQVSYVTHLSRYFRLFGAANVHVVLFDDVRHDPRQAFNRVLTFLGLSPVAGFEPQTLNRAKEVRSVFVRSLILNGPRLTRHIARHVVPARLRLAMWRRAMLLNSRPASRPVTDAELLKELAAEQKPMVAELSALLGTDLSSWAEPPSYGNVRQRASGEGT